jgi:hypothetical protein
MVMLRWTHYEAPHFAVFSCYCTCLGSTYCPEAGSAECFQRASLELCRPANPLSEPPVAMFDHQIWKCGNTAAVSTGPVTQGGSQSRTGLAPRLNRGLPVQKRSSAVHDTALTFQPICQNAAGPRQQSSDQVVRSKSMFVFRLAPLSSRARDISGISVRRDCRNVRGGSGSLSLESVLFCCSVVAVSMAMNPQVRYGKKGVDCRATDCLRGAPCLRYLPAGPI